MIIKSGINFLEPGLRVNIRAMHLDSEIVGILNSNIGGFDKVGYQRKDPVVASACEYIGIHGLSTAIDDNVGRIMVSANPLDVALTKKGYFEVEGSQGKKMTRDGRFHIDKDGNLLTLTNEKVLADDGTAIQLQIVPDKLDEIKINNKGAIYVLNKKNLKMEYVANLSVVTPEGIAVLDPDVKQGYNEYSNVSLHKEFMELMPVVKNFDANRQIFIIQNNNLATAIQELGKTS